VLRGTSVYDALEKISKGTTASINRVFLIGGAQLYNECLTLPISNTVHVDRVLLTRIHEPAFDECDTFMSDVASSPEWNRASHEELEAWVGMDVPSGMQQENGVQYEFQMWTRR
jgi:dihydrofolate reductase